ncbi:MAG: response regulator [Bacteroidota bacterium]
MAQQRLIVIIDDEEDLLDLYEYNFIKHGFEVATFNRASKALKYIKEQTPIAILCDWMMPEMDGLELCRKIKSDIELADIPFLMVTCRTDKNSVKQALASGATDFITKPVGMNQLIQHVNAIITQSTNTMTG